MARKKPLERNYIQQFLEKIANPKNNAVRYSDKPRRVNRFNRHRCAANLTGVSLCTVLAECCILIEYPIAPNMVNRFYSSATRADSGMGSSVLCISPLAPRMTERLYIAVNICIAAYLTDMSCVTGLSTGSFGNGNIIIAVCALEVVASRASV